jgi:hypothetical protein
MSITFIIIFITLQRTVRIQAFLQTNIGMDPELIRIRREKWLQTKGLHLQESEGLQHDESTPPPMTSKQVTNDAPNNPSNHNNDGDNDAIDLTGSSDEETQKKYPRDSVIYLSDSSSDSRPIRNKTSSSRKRKVDDVATTKTNAISKNDSTFSICTYNIWFGDAHPIVRMNHISQIVSQQIPRPTFLGLQEVTPYLLNAIAPLLTSLGYGRIMFQEGVTYGCALAVLTDDIDSSASATILRSGFEPYTNSCMARGLMWVHAKLKYTDIEILFTTTHLESYINTENDGSKAREVQLKEAINFCLDWQSKYRVNPKSSSAMIITGDLNWDDERKRSLGTNTPLLSIANDDSNVQEHLWQDSWLESNGPRHDGYTYDSKENPMLKGNLRRRFDRCLVCSPSQDIVTLSSELVGKEIIEGYTYRKEVPEWRYGKPTGSITYQDRPLCASDHFGLVVKFKVHSSLSEHSE